jgi:hypothetical protein
MLVSNFEVRTGSAHDRQPVHRLCKAAQTNRSETGTITEKDQEVSMNVVRMLAIVSLGIVLTAPPAVAQTLSRYRAYALESSLASIAKTSGARDADLRTLHVRPSRIQELEWRAPYVKPGRAPADPVRSVVFSFYDDQLYRVVVTYDRDRTEGLTDRDVLDSISATYDALPTQARESDSARVDLPANSRVVARWDDGSAVLALVRSSYSREFKLVLISKRLSALASSATAEALRLDVKEAPQREQDQRTKAVADVRDTQEKARSVNKAAFKP